MGSSGTFQPLQRSLLECTWSMKAEMHKRFILVKHKYNNKQTKMNKKQSHT